MYRINFVVWLSAGIVFGWLISQMVEMENRRSQKLHSIEVPDSEQE